MEQKQASIFRRYFTEEPFADRFVKESQHAVDVVIPVLHTNELWKKNLISIYREIPVNRLLIGDAGCMDDSIGVVKQFPRVVVYDHSKFISLGYSIRKLIEAVETEWFIYLHADVYLPDGWFDEMSQCKDKYDWFECSQKVTVLLEYLNDVTKNPRGFGLGGSTMGRRSAFENVTPYIDDDYVYRNEDIVLRALLEQAGYRWGFTKGEIFHYHQQMHKVSPTGRQIKSFSYQLEMSKEEEIRTFNMQIRGFVKYVNPTPRLVYELHECIFRLLELKEFNLREFKQWVAKTNPKWLPVISKKKLIKKQLLKAVYTIYNLLFKKR